MTNRCYRFGPNFEHRSSAYRLGGTRLRCPTNRNILGLAQILFWGKLWELWNPANDSLRNRKFRFSPLFHFSHAFFWARLMYDIHCEMFIYRTDPSCGGANACGRVAGGHSFVRKKSVSQSVSQSVSCNQSDTKSTYFGPIVCGPRSH